jgi:hypothetical protein
MDTKNLAEPYDLPPLHWEAITNGGASRWTF